MMYTTFALLRKAGACESSYRFLAKKLGGIIAYGRDTPISLEQILDICGLDDALWALRAVPNSEHFSRLLTCDYAEHVLPLNDDRPRRAIETARRYTSRQATQEELHAAKATARAAWDAPGAAWDAARAAWDTERQWQKDTLRTRLKQ